MTPMPIPARVTAAVDVAFDAHGTPARAVRR
jgi:hypothetical protein